MRHRLFLALPLPKELSSEVQSLHAQIKTPLLWFDSERFHLTLNFLGNITDEQLPGLQSSLLRVIQNSPVFELHLGFVNTMYRKHDGSYLCLTPDQKSEPLMQLQENLKKTVYHLDVPVADRFWPHITIAYLPKSDPVSTKALLDKIDSLNLSVHFSWLVDKVVLFESKSDRTGTHYSRVATYPLT